MQASEVQLLLSAPQAPSGYAAPGVVYNSLGRWCSTTQVNYGVPMNNVFPDLTGPQTAAQQTDYQCLFVYNPDPTDTMTNVVAWLPLAGILTTAINWAVGADSIGASLLQQSGTPQAGYITSPLVAPGTIGTWATPSAAVTGGAQMPSIPPGSVAALWIRRQATGIPAMGAGFNLQVTFDVLG